jgi:hypothetical protein
MLKGGRMSMQTHPRNWSVCCWATAAKRCAHASASLPRWDSTDRRDNSKRLKVIDNPVNDPRPFLVAEFRVEGWHGGCTAYCPGSIDPGSQTRPGYWS